MVLLLLLASAVSKRETLVTIAIVALVVDMTFPQLYRPVAVLWLGLSHLLGTVVSKILLTLVFFGVVTPIGLARKLLGIIYRTLKNNWVFEQIWIGADDKLPRLLHAVYLEDPERLRHTLILSDWQLDPAVPADSFTSTKAASANPMLFAHPHPETSPAAEPAAKGKPSKPHQTN